MFRENNKTSVHAEDCSMLLDFHGSISPESEIINEILEEPIDPETNNDYIFSNDDPQTNNDDIFSAAMECVEQPINDIVKGTTKEEKNWEESVQ